MLIMDICNSEGMTFSNIRQTIREHILPLVQAIYDENPSDIILFCSTYFNDLLHKRESDMKNMSQNTLNCVQEINEKTEDDVEYLNRNIESDDANSFPTTIQGSASAPILTTNKLPGGVNLRGTSSWDTPANSIEPIKSLAVLEDAASGIGDQTSTEKSQIALENEVEICDTNLKHEFEGDSFREHEIVDEVKKVTANEEYLKSTYPHSKSTGENLSTLFAEFQRMKTSDDTLKHDNLSSNQETETMTDINMCRKQLSPNSSFGFIPHMKEYDLEEEIKDLYGKNFKSQTSDIKVTKKNISETLYSLETEIIRAETNFNEEIRNAKEICDVIQGRNEADTNKSDQICDMRNDTEEKNMKIIANSFDQHDLENIKNENDEKVLPTELAARNIPGHFYPEVNVNGNQETKGDLTEPIVSQLEKFCDKEKPKSTSIDDIDDYDKSDHTESQVIVDKLWRKRWYEAHPSFGNLSRLQSRDSRLYRGHFSAHRSNIGEAGDVPADRFYIPNGISNIDCRSRNHISAESSTGIKEFNCSRLLSDEINHRSNSARPFENIAQKKTSSEKISSANPQNIPYSWRKLSKQSRSSENVTNYSQEPQTNSNEEIHNSVNSRSKDLTFALNEVKKLSEIDGNEVESTLYKKSEEIIHKTKTEIKGPKEEKLLQYDENAINIQKLINNQRLSIHNAKQETVIDVSTDSTDKTQSNAYCFHQNGICDQNITEKKVLAQNCKQNVTEDGMEIKANDMEKKTKAFFQNGTLLHLQKNKAVSQNSDDSVKDKFDLNAACGDFVSSANDANEQNTDSQNALIENEENYETEQKNERKVWISKEYVKEVIERVNEQHQNDSKDSYDSLNYSSYSESDSSYQDISDCSETDDLNASENVQQDK